MRFFLNKHARLSGLIPIFAMILNGCAGLPQETLTMGDWEPEQVAVTKAVRTDDAPGKPGAFGEPYNPDDLTAAHPSLPYGTHIRVMNMDTGRAAVLRVADRPESREARRLLVSAKAAERLGIKRNGEANILIDEVDAQVGIASWYGPSFHGRQTSNGETYNQDALTAAHRYLPFGTLVRVTNQKTGDSVVVRINDRGAFIRGRIIDLSRGAAKQVGLLTPGTGLVRIDVLPPVAPGGNAGGNSG